MFLSLLLYYLLRINLKRDGENVNYHVFACVAEVNSKDQDELQSVGRTASQCTGGIIVFHCLEKGPLTSSMSPRIFEIVQDR